MVRIGRKPEELTGKVFLSSDVIAQGLLTAAEIRSRRWINVLHGVYADADLPYDHELKCRAALVRCPQMIVAGPSALYLAGLRAVAGPADPVHGIMPAPQKTHRYYPQGIAVHESVHPVEVDPASDPQVPRTHTLRAIWDSCRWLHAPQALGVADAALHKSLATVLDYRAFEQAPPDPRMKWSRQAGTVLAAADGRVRHPHISAIRATLLHQRSVPAPQIMVRLAPEPGPVLDLAWVRQRVGIVLGKAGAVAAAKLRWRTLAVDPDTPPDLPTIVRRITALLAEGPAAAQANAKVTLGR